MATQIGTVIDGKYEILKQIGKGGMSIVYLAMDKRLNKQWAVKEIKRKGFDKNHEEVINEVPADAEMMKSLDHPAIPRIVDIIDNRNSEYIYIVMDYVEGESLDKVINEYGAQPQDLVIDWAKQICDALGYLHSQKPPIIYRDMKPANIMLKPEGNIKIIDFGIAREYKDKNLADTEVLGTRGYAPDEQYKGHTVIQSDIYAFGMTLHHLLTGVDPRPADYIYAPIRQWNPELSAGLEQIIEKCTATRIEDRYQNCNELMYALEHYEEEGEAYKKKQKRKLSTFIISICMAVIFAVTGLVTGNLSNKAERNNYDELIEITGAGYDTAAENIQSAIKIDNQDRRAYDNFLDFIISDDNISEKEAQGFSNLYNAYKSTYKDKVYSDAFAEISYKAGIDMFLYYNIDNNSSTSDRALKAINYFAAIQDGGYKDSERAKSFYKICEFYKKDSKNSVDATDYKELYADMFKSMNECIEAIDNYDSYDKEKAPFVKCAMYKSVLDFINANISDIADPHYGAVEEDTVNAMLDIIEEKVNDVTEDRNKESRLYQTRQYVIDNIDNVRNTVTTHYAHIE
ncbi:MAG: serine/threonine protein kinase [Eubacterium sp.]